MRLIIGEFVERQPGAESFSKSMEREMKKKKEKKRKKIAIGKEDCFL